MNGGSQRPPEACAAGGPSMQPSGPPSAGALPQHVPGARWIGGIV